MNLKTALKITGVAMGTAAAIGLSMGMTYFILNGTIKLSNALLNLKLPKKVKVINLDDHVITYVFE